MATTDSSTPQVEAAAATTESSLPSSLSLPPPPPPLPDDSNTNDNTTEQLDILRQALAQATHHLELARSQEAELEAWTVYASALLKIPPGSQTTVDAESDDDNNNISNLLPAGGLQDAWKALTVVTEQGMTTTLPTGDPNRRGGQWAVAVHRAAQATSIRSMAEQAQTIETSRLLEGGPALQQALQTIATTAGVGSTNGAPPQHAWLQLLDERLAQLRVYHARHDPAPSQNANKKPRLGNPAADGYDLAAAVTQHLQPLQTESQFGAPEVLGKYLDLQGLWAAHDAEWMRSSPAKATTTTTTTTTSWQYIDFLQVLSRGLDTAWPEATKLSVRKKYVRLLTDLQMYLQSFLHRTVPLLNVEQLQHKARQEVNEIWRRTGGVPPVWQAKPAEAVLAETSNTTGTTAVDGQQQEDASSNKPAVGIDLSLYATPADLEAAVEGDNLKTELARLGLKCGGTVRDRAERLFLLKDTPLSELPLKHFAKRKTTSSSSNNNNKTAVDMNRIDVARLEAAVIALIDQVRPTLEATLRRVERQMGQTLTEREKELQEELYGSQVVVASTGTTTKSGDDSDDGSDAPIYNPKNVPLDWDGKPIPYWLFKLHGLNHYYSCEICGGESYRGRRNFELHFADQKHTAGMKSLGIPNTKHFHGVTKIDDVRQLWETLNSKVEQEQFDGTREEEYEDSHGNVLSRTTYEDLARQGLL